ncbi:hypothetical protein P4B35_14160 [Pontiellaceae bacterium B12227]|nr:hypothetical protein [Pontiellaceae bacterium B12227]
MKRLAPILIVTFLTVLIIIVAPFTHWEQCRICGVQKIERGFFRQKVDSWSLDEFDEYGTYAQWKELNKADACVHQFTEVKHKTPKMTLEQLAAPENH